MRIWFWILTRIASNLLTFLGLEVGRGVKKLSKRQRLPEIESTHQARHKLLSHSIKRRRIAGSIMKNI